MQGAIAATEALPNYVLAAAIGVTTAANIALIAAQRYPGLYKGGIVPGQGQDGALYRLGDKGRTETVLPYDIRKQPVGGERLVFQGPFYLYGAGGKSEFIDFVTREMARRKQRGVTSQ